MVKMQTNDEPTPASTNLLEIDLTKKDFTKSLLLTSTSIGTGFDGTSSSWESLTLQLSTDSPVEIGDPIGLSSGEEDVVITNEVFNVTDRSATNELNNLERHDVPSLSNEQAPPSKQQSLAYERARISEYFDEDFYKAQLPADISSGLDVIAHYLTVGWREDLDPSPTFSTGRYLSTHTDVRDASKNPLLHYAESGRIEGRRIWPSSMATPGNSLSDAVTFPEREITVAAQSTPSRQRFDQEFYLEHSPDLVGAPIDPFDHFMEHGWRELRDPCPDFSTAYYLEHNSDVAAAGINPFQHYIEHGQREGRHGLPYLRRVERRIYEPFVTVIVPNYNHARFLSRRLDTILYQTFKNFELIILDDNSSDDSKAVINAYKSRFPSKITCIFNEENSGGVFKQWKKGIEKAQGDLIWICESDDFCETNFLECCIKPLADASVMVAFGRIQFADAEGAAFPGLDSFRNNAEPNIWNKPVTRPASSWFKGAFAIANIIPNVGGCVFRKQTIPDSVWAELLTYKIVGDWYLYAILAQGGQLSFVPEAKAYFRQHGSNTSVSGFKGAQYYIEHERIIKYLRARWGVTDDVSLRFCQETAKQYQYAKAETRLGRFVDNFSVDRVLQSAKSHRHVLIAFLGFHLGGGELFPIHLANELINAGYIVSVLIMNSHNENPLVRQMLDARVAVYDGQYVSDIGLDNFIDAIGVDIIHSHNISVELMFFEKNRFSKYDLPYIVTLHGSYEVTSIADDTLLRIIRGVSCWIYLTKRNLSHLRRVPLQNDRLQVIENGMPLDAREFSSTRADLGILEQDLVFTIASRAILDKGWEIAIRALLLAQSRTPRRLHVILCGSGPEVDRLQPKYGSHPQVHFMGFQERISGIYRLSDVAILPTRFGGESHPLTLIQAMQAGKPVIATDVGEIRSMLTKNAACAGLLLSPTAVDTAFAEELASAMVTFTDNELRRRYSEMAAEVGAGFDIAVVARRYAAVYERLVEAAQSAEA